MQIVKKYPIMLVLMAVLVTIISCEKEIKFKGEAVQPMMVLNGLINPDSAIKVHLSKSKFFLSDEYGTTHVVNADIEIFINGISKGKMQYQDRGVYTSSVYPNIHDTVELVVANTDLPGVRAKVTIPDQSTIISMDTTIKIIEFDDSDFINYGNSGGEYGEDWEVVERNTFKDILVSLKFKDPGSIENFYRLNAKTQYVEYYDDSLSIYEEYRPITIEGVDNTANNDITGIFDFMVRDQYSHTMTDEFFDGRENSLKFRFLLANDNYEYWDDSWGERPTGGLIRPEPDSTNLFLVVNLQAVSKEMHYYYKTKASATEVVEFFSEPVQIFSNVANGAGVLGSYINNEIRFKLE